MNVGCRWCRMENLVSPVDVIYFLSFCWIFYASKYSSHFIRIPSTFSCCQVSIWRILAFYVPSLMPDSHIIGFRFWISEDFSLHFYLLIGKTIIWWRGCCLPTEGWWLMISDGWLFLVAGTLFSKIFNLGQL